MPGYIDQCDAAFSMWMRIKCSDDKGRVECITCGIRGYYSDFDNGHGVPRANQATRFDERNCAPQCRVCNRIKGGEPERFAAAVDRIHGPGTWDDLVILGKTVCKRTKAEVIEMAKYYWSEVRRLKKEKGL